ncbi:uncharacterized protein LOC111412079 [Olea europaea var. sylvestris]|uniref:uncharacterized protein LOC111412079 n=1 Tax=Olea europaea var. sylvestris TaxID=158386 RepID=UPI000C1D1888|nr:uncharacterized protein LOC111412079 [Olea europaea var. sylvestris]
MYFGFVKEKEKERAKLDSFNFLSRNQLNFVVFTVIERRDVPGRETPLHLAVHLRDATSAEILMRAVVDWSHQNENGWSSPQEVVCNREDNIAMIIAWHDQPLAWAQ